MAGDRADVDAAVPVPAPALGDPARQLPRQRADRRAQLAQLRRRRAQYVEVLEPARGDEPDTGPAVDLSGQVRIATAPKTSSGLSIPAAKYAEALRGLDDSQLGKERVEMVRLMRDSRRGKVMDDGLYDEAVARLELIDSEWAARFISKKEGDYAQLRLPSGEVRRFHVDCRAVVGQVGNIEHENLQYGKAGRSRWLGRNPSVRGVAMNPVDHPMGGGEGKSSGGRHPCSPWGKITKGLKTRKRKLSDALIVRRRKK